MSRFPFARSTPCVKRGIELHGIQKTAESSGCKVIKRPCNSNSDNLKASNRQHRQVLRAYNPGKDKLSSLVVLRQKSAQAVCRAGPVISDLPIVPEGIQLFCLLAVARLGAASAILLMGSPNSLQVLHCLYVLEPERKYARRYQCCSFAKSDKGRPIWSRSGRECFNNFCTKNQDSATGLNMKHHAKKGIISMVEIFHAIATTFEYPQGMGPALLVKDGMAERCEE